MITHRSAVSGNHGHGAIYSVCVRRRRGARAAAAVTIRIPVCLCGLPGRQRRAVGPIHPRHRTKLHSLPRDTPSVRLTILQRSAPLLPLGRATPPDLRSLRRARIWQSRVGGQCIWARASLCTRALAVRTSERVRTHTWSRSHTLSHPC